MAGLAGLLAIALALLFYSTSPDGWSEEEISRLTKGLNEAAAIGVPHGFLMDDDVRQAHAALLSRVEEGTVLDK